MRKTLDNKREKMYYFDNDIIITINCYTLQGIMSITCSIPEIKGEYAMAIISCPECGKQVSDRAVSCPDCGFPINTEAATPLQVDNSKEIEKLIILARRARESSDSKNAKKYYDQILEKDPGNWEAMFFSVYFEASECKILYISSAANSVANSIYSTFSAIADLKSEEEKESALDTVISSAVAISLMLVSGAISHYNQFPTTNNAFGECSNRVVSSGNIYAEIVESLKKVFPEKKERIATQQKVRVTFMINNSKWYNNNFLTTTINTLGNEIREFDPDYQTPEIPAPASGGCYVATAVYGSYDCPQVWTLRRYRDNVLAETWYGRAFIKTYYAVSPTLVRWFGETDWFKKLWKGKLDHMVIKLQSNGVESTPYEDKNW